MVHLIQLGIRPTLLYTLLGFVHQFNCMIPTSREGINADPAWNIAPQWQWHEVPAIPAARSSAVNPAENVAPPWQWQEIPVIPAAHSSDDNVGYPEHIGDYPHYNDQSVLLTQPQSAGYYNVLYPTNAFNHLSPTLAPPASVFIPLGPPTSAPPVTADAIEHRASRVPGNARHSIPPGQSKDFRDNAGAASRILEGHRSSIRNSFDAEIKQKMLNADPFVPGRASLVRQDDINKQGKESQVVPKDQEAFTRESSNQINQAGQTRDHLEEVAEPEVSRVHPKTKSSPEVTKLKSFDYAMDPNHFRRLQNFILQHSNAKSKTPAVNHELPQSIGSHGFNEARQESLGPAIEQTADPDKSSTSSSAGSSSLSESNI